MYSIRAVLEALVVGQFVELASDEELDQLASYGETLKKAYLSGSVKRILRAKRAFYDCICSGAQNALAFDIINRLTLRTSTLRSRSLARKERQKQSVKEIDAILVAIGARDIHAAKQAAAAHVEHASNSALNAPDAAPIAAPADKPSRRSRAWR